MIKIYHAMVNKGSLVLKKGIDLSNGGFNTEKRGYGTITSKRETCKNAEYLVDSIDNFQNYVIGVNSNHGWIKNNPFEIDNLYATEDLEKSQVVGKLPKTLDEEGILLFTSNVIVSFIKDQEKSRKWFGRYPAYGAYMLYAGTLLEMSREHDASKSYYEVIESGYKPKQLYLVKSDRKIID